MAARAVAPAEMPFPHVAQVARIDRRRELADGRVQTETAFVLSSRGTAALGELPLAEAVRRHWGIENALHHRRDRTYDEDRSQVRQPATAQIMATLRNLAVAARHHLAPSCLRKRSRTLPQMHRRLAAKPHHAVALIVKPWR